MTIRRFHLFARPGRSAAPRVENSSKTRSCAPSSHENVVRCLIRERVRASATMDGQNNNDVRLLIAEDHASLGRSMAEGLREEGYQVDLAADGVEAEKLLAEHEYACVILDLILPGKEGLTLLREMRLKGNQAPVMCVTARDALDDR